VTAASSKIKTANAQATVPITIFLRLFTDYFPLLLIDGRFLFIIHFS